MRQKPRLNKLEQVLNYKFKDPALLELALTHKSFHKGQDNRNNERLEFLGDAVLQIVVSEHLYKRYPDFPEGQLAKIRAFCVSQPTLAKNARRLKLDTYLKVGKGEEQTGAQQRDSLLCDVYEAVLGAIYLDSDLATVRPIIIANLPSWSHEKLTTIDAKSTLQEHLQQSGEDIPTYCLVEERGPDHDKEFVVAVKINNEMLGKGVGKSKKEAAQMAAREALQKFDL